MIVELIGWGWAFVLVIVLVSMWLVVTKARGAYQRGWRDGYTEGQRVGYADGVRNMGSTLRLAQDVATFGGQDLNEAVRGLQSALGVRD